MDAEISRLLAGYPAFCTLPIQWGEQDAFGHVNNIIYFRWFESARIAYGNRVGLSELFETKKIGPILAAVGCNYRRQLIFPDTVHVGARITKIGRTSFVMEHRVVSENLRAVAAEGDSTVVMFDYGAQRPIPVSPALRQAVEQLEGPDSPLAQLGSVAPPSSG
jgi:acyl-CoA thioester hydrolase